MSVESEASVEQPAKQSESTEPPAASSPASPSASKPEADAPRSSSPEAPQASEQQTDQPEQSHPAAATPPPTTPETSETPSAPAEGGEAAVLANPTEAVAADPSAASGSQRAAGAPSSPTPGETSASRPSQRIQIGSQRAAASKTEEKPRPVTPPKEPARKPATPPKSYPPPNVRDKLSPEMERELEAAFGGESVESLLDAASHEATTELAAESKVTGQVVSVHGEDVFLELPGARHQGVIPIKQFETPPQPGAELEAVVVRFNSDQGLYELTRSTAAVEVGNWDEVAEGQVVEVTVTGANKGGLECKLAGIRGFIPMGQISIYRVDNAEEYVGQRLTCVITEANRSRNNLVLSHRALMERERKEKREKLLAELEPGQVRDGTVRSLQDFGAFVDLGGVDGLIHISQISWDRIAHPKEVLSVGEAVKVRVVKVNQETGKIGLAYRDLGENPWTKAAEKYPSGSRVKGVVTKLMQFGAFVKLEPGVEGLIHISELGHGRVQRTGDVVSEGQEVEIQVLSVDTDAQKIGLSLKALMPKPTKDDPATGADSGRDDAGGKPQRDDRSGKRRRKPDPNLKGGLGGPSGGEQFGLKW